MSEEYKQKQQQLIFDTIIKADMVITTALIPGREAPELITEEMVKAMKPGAVVNMAAIAGGNCKLTKAGELTEAHGVKLIGYTDLASRAGADASKLYAKNLLILSPPYLWIKKASWMYSGSKAGARQSYPRA